MELSDIRKRLEEIDEKITAFRGSL